jgi:Fe-S cluster assembly ATPase SufC
MGPNGAGKNVRQSSQEMKPVTDGEIILEEEEFS